MSFQILSKKRRSFTLLEMVLCFAILSLLTATFSFNMMQALEARRFEASTGHLVMKLKELQILAMSYRSDITLELSPIKGQICYKIRTDEPIPYLERGKETSLKGISYLTLDNKRINNVTLQIFSSGRIEPKKVLGLHLEPSSDEKHFFELDMHTPLQIKLYDKLVR